MIPAAHSTASSQPAFDDSIFPERVRRRLNVRAAAIHRRLGIRRVVSSAKAVVQVGLRLHAIRNLVGRRHFQAWLRAHFSWKQPSATKFMRSAAVFKGADFLDRFQPSALYRLSRKNVPPEAIADAIALARSGEKITQSWADAIVRACQGLPDDMPPDIEEACTTIEEAPWATVVVVCPLLYVLSFGPVCWLSKPPVFAAGEMLDYPIDNDGESWNSDADARVPVIYWPMGWLLARGPGLISSTISWFATIGRREDLSLWLPADPAGSFWIRIDPPLTSLSETYRRDQRQPAAIAR
jgi:hypothetical protein